MNSVVVLNHEGDEIRLQVGMLAIRLYCESEECSMSELFSSIADEKKSVWVLCDFSFFAHSAYNELNGLPTEYTKLQATEWMAAILEKSGELMKKMQAMVPTDGKKKAVETKSKKPLKKST